MVGKAVEGGNVYVMFRGLVENKPYEKAESIQHHEKQDKYKEICINEKMKWGYPFVTPAISNHKTAQTGREEWG
jgi:hypothetical protein